jgi:hypothetical protein
MRIEVYLQFMKKKPSVIFNFFSVLAVLSLIISPASAASVTSFSDTMSTVKVSTTSAPVSSNHTFVFTTPTGVGSGATIVFTFPQEFVIPAGLSFTDVDMNVGGPYLASSTLAAAPAGATVGVVRTSTTTLTITNGTTVLASSSVIYVRIGTNAIFQTTGVNQIVNATTTGNKTIGLNGTFGDTGSTTVNIITDDAVQVRAVVPQSLTFSISATSTYFGNLSAGAAKFASSTNVNGDASETIAHTLAVSTNAPYGYVITIQGSTLTSLQNASNTIPSIGLTAASSTAGTSQFGIRASSTGGTGATVATPYSFATSYAFTPTATTSSLLASGSGSTNTTTYHLRYVANVSGVQEAGNYATALTYVATASF